MQIIHYRYRHWCRLHQCPVQIALDQKKLVQSTLSNSCRSPGLFTHAHRRDAGERRPPVPAVVMCLSLDAMSRCDVTMRCDAGTMTTDATTTTDEANLCRPPWAAQTKRKQAGLVQAQRFIYPRNLETLLRGLNNPFSITVPSIFSGYPPTS